MTRDKPSILAPQMEEITLPAQAALPSAARILHGRLIPPQQQILLYSSDEWERFIHEWVHYQKSRYKRVARLSGAGDMGIDVAGFTDADELWGDWDNYQCKHYANSLGPKTAIIEIAKCLWHSFNQSFKPPRNYYFMAPKDCGIELTSLLSSLPALKTRVFSDWDKWAADAITSTQTIQLAGDFRTYAEQFDYSIFKPRTSLEVIEEHRLTPFFPARFGGGLPDRPASDVPPAEPHPKESRYLEQLAQAYADKLKRPLTTNIDLAQGSEFGRHYTRQREYFYHAESLRNFARDTVPSGTYEELQDEIFAGVIELCESEHIDGFERINATTQEAVRITMTASALITVAKAQDKRGICHQLANANRLLWVKT